MSNTTNLNLEEISVNDNVKTTFIQKLNDNNAKIDNAFGYLKEQLIDATGEHDLASAVEDYKNDFANIVGEYQERVQELEQDISTLESIGTASASDIKSGQTALVQGQTITGSAFGTTTTASASDIINGKTAYSNNGTLLTGTLVPQTIEEQKKTGQSSNSSITFTFDEDITNKRIIFFALPESTYLRTASTKYLLVNYDSNNPNYAYVLRGGASNTSYIYRDTLSSSNYTITKSGKNITFAGTGSYYVGGYSTSYTAELHCIAL